MKKGVLIILFVSLGSMLWGQGNGQASFQILQTASSARIAALGGNQIAVKDGDLNLGLVAPSLLDSASTRQVAFNYTRFFGASNMSQVGYAHQIKSLGTISLSFSNLGYGTFDQTNESGEVIGSFSAGEYMFQAGIGRQLEKNFSIGANVKYIWSQLADYTSSALAVDVSGTYYKPEKLFTATLMMKNIGSTLKSYNDNIDQDLPFEIQAAISKKLSKAPLRFTLVGENLQTWDLTPVREGETEIDPLTGEEIEPEQDGFGENLMRHLVFNAEILLSKNFHVRVGYNYNRRQQLKIEDKPGAAGFTYGLGLRVAKIHLSYGRAAYTLAGVSNHFSISVKFDDFKKKS
jgi:hypothetical protein